MFLARLLLDAGGLATSIAKSGLSVSRKSEMDFVTEADLSVETLIRTAIANEFPEDGLIGEEMPTVSGESARIWVIDPIDGTHNYAIVRPFCGISVGLIEDDYPVAGANYCPSLQQLLFADKSGVWLNGKPLPDQPSESFLVC